VSKDLKHQEQKEHKPADKLCDANSGKGALQCYWSTSCPGANGNNCNPYNVWSGDKQRTDYYYNGNLNSGTFYATTGNYNYYTNAFGVRCVLDLNSPKQKRV